MDIGDVAVQKVRGSCKAVVGKRSACQEIPSSRDKKYSRVEPSIPEGSTRLLPT